MRKIIIWYYFIIREQWNHIKWGFGVWCRISRIFIYLGLVFPLISPTYAELLMFSIHETNSQAVMACRVPPPAFHRGWLWPTYRHSLLPSVTFSGSDSMELILTSPTRGFALSTHCGLFISWLFKLPGVCLNPFSEYDFVRNGSNVWMSSFPGGKSHQECLLPRGSTPEPHSRVSGLLLPVLLH